MQPSLASESEPQSARTRANRANALHSTGPVTEAGKLRASRNAVTHGLTSRAPVLRSEDPAAYQHHCREFHDEYHPATPTEKHLVQELADTAWRLNRIPQLEAELLRDAHVRDPYHALATLGMHGQRLSRQFHKTLDQLRALQGEHRKREANATKPPAPPLRSSGLAPKPAAPVAAHGFVFSAPPALDPAQLLAREQHASVAVGASK